MGHFEKTVNFLQLWTSCILFGCKCKGIPLDIVNSIFLRSKKIISSGAAGEKKLGYGAKNVAFYTTESLNAPFLGVRLRGRLSSVRKVVQGGGEKLNPESHFFFLFFPKPVNQLVLVLKPAKVPKLFP